MAGWDWHIEYDRAEARHEEEITLLHDLLIETRKILKHFKPELVTLSVESGTTYYGGEVLIKRIDDSLFFLHPRHSPSSWGFVSLFISLVLHLSQ